MSLCVILLNSVQYGIMVFSGFYNMHALQCAHLGTGAHIAEAEIFGEKNEKTVEKTTKEELYYLGHSYDFILIFFSSCDFYHDINMIHMMLPGK